ncbi:MAG: carbohydrate kinase family protein [Acholeplasmataceae bacterium]|nr:carbohydrate kinase family protein [Acholeplasmataceae bacterium]
MTKIVIIGGTNFDLLATANNPIQLYDSNPGTLKKSYGGVGRNIAENMARLGLSPYFITVIGRDEVGQSMIVQGSNLGIHFDPINVEQTPTYLAVLDQDKDMVVAVAAMEDVRHLTIAEIKKRDQLIKSSDMIVLDTNFSEDTMAYIFDTYKKPIHVDVISTTKAQKIVPHYTSIHTLKMNIYEAISLSGISYKEVEDVQNIGQFFINQGVKEVFITLGSKGAYHYDGSNHKSISTVHVEIENTTGAGDAFFAGVLYAKIKHKDPLKCGVAAAIITLKDEKAVASFMSEEKLVQTMKEYNL